MAQKLADPNYEDLFSDRKLNKIASQFSVAELEYSFSPLTDGFINDTFLVLEQGSPQFILQRVNHTVFPNISGVMNNIQNALKHLNSEDYTKIRLVETKTGANYLEQKHGDSDYWRMMTYIPQSTAYNTTTDTKIAFEAGRVIGNFHDLLQNEDTEIYVDTIPRFHSLSLRKKQFKQALEFSEKVYRAKANSEPAVGAQLGRNTDVDTKKSNRSLKEIKDLNIPPDTSNKNEIVTSAIRFAEETLLTLEKINFGHLPIRICHNDTKLNNILFSKETGRALCLIDLDTLMKGHFLYDFGDAIRTIVNTAPEDEQDHSKITFETTLFEGFVNGLATKKSLFSPSEIETLAWGAVLMPFLHGIRALTDYLAGNIYYKVSYENQNLDRSLSLFHFTKKALAKIEYMEKVIERKFH